MSQELAEERMKKISKKAEAYANWDRSQIKMLCATAMVELDELQAEIERLSNPWVSVEDGLPEDDGRYLTSDGTDWWTGNFFDQDRGWSEFNKIITRWMKIPERKE